MTKINDSLEDLIGAEKRSEPRNPPNSYLRVQASYNEPCRKCGGTGMTRWGRCFACEGVGSKTFSTSPEARAKGRTQNVERKASAATEALAAFEAQHPQVWAWIKANAGKFDFATKMVEAIVRYGSLTDGQMAACVRCVDREAARTAQQAQQAPAVDTAGVDRLKAAFDKAIAYSRAKGKGRTIKSPRITIGDVVVSPAKETSANPGALYVKSGGTYLGKIANGQFFASRECGEVEKTKVLAFVADPKGAAEAYGIETGMCCICNATLTNKESIERGIGPICGEKFGW